METRPQTMNRRPQFVIHAITRIVVAKTGLDRPMHEGVRELPRTVYQPVKMQRQIALEHALMYVLV
jgi:hypothetical protein